MDDFEKTLNLEPIETVEAVDWLNLIRDEHARFVPDMIRNGSAKALGIFAGHELRGVVVVSVDDGMLEINALAGQNLGRYLGNLADAFQRIAASTGLNGVKIYTVRRGLVRQLARIGAVFSEIGPGRWVGVWGVSHV